MRYLLFAAIIMVGYLAGCTPPNHPPSGEAISANSGPPEPMIEPTEPPAGGIHWYSDFTQAKAQAEALGRPILVDFYTDWCSWCTKLDKEVWPDEAVVKAAEAFICARVNGDENQELAKNFNVNSYPTIMVVTPKGKVLGKAVGFQPADAMTKFLKSSK